VLPCVRTRDGDVDGIPNAIGEAMAMRLPVVSTDLPAIRELVSDGVNGSIVPPGDAASLADAIAHLLDDPALRGRMGDEGRRTVEDRFDVEQNVGRFVSTLWPDRLDREVAIR
jgi:glycosyltransferase involved in cell wall biosynthesis